VCRYVQYNQTSLERNYKFDLLTEHDLGVPIDLINPDTYLVDHNGQQSLPSLFHSWYFNLLHVELVCDMLQHSITRQQFFCHISNVSYRNSFGSDYLLSHMISSLNDLNGSRFSEVAFHKHEVFYVHCVYVHILELF